jgi:hypothetical protein
MNRRNFFSRLFGRDNRGEPVFIGIQMVTNAYGDEGLRKKVHAIINESADDETPEEKKRYFKKLASVLLENELYFEYGYWDVLTDPVDAQAEFESWISEIEASMATESEELGTEANELYRTSSSKYYVVVTLCFLMENDDHLTSFFDAIDAIPESEYWNRNTFGKVLAAINYLDFEYSFGDAAFIMPGNEEDGISSDDIMGEGWNYLKPLS